MIKVLNQYFPGRLFVLLVTENLLILSGLWLGIGYHVGSLRLSLLSYPTVFGKVLLITVICQFCLYYADIYDLRTVGSRIEVLMRVLQALGAAALILAMLFYFFPEARLGAGIVETSLLTMVVGILLWRIFMEWLNRAYSAGERILLVGSGAAGVELTRELRHRPDLPINVIGMLSEEESAEHAAIPGVQSLGTLKDLATVIVESKPHRVIIALRERRQQLPIDVLLRFRMKGMIIEEASTLSQKITGRVPVESVHPSSLIFSDEFRQSATQRLYGRVVGLIAAMVAAVFAGPLMAIIAVLIKVDTKGPVFYRQAR